MRPLFTLALACCIAAGASGALAQSVSLSGSLGNNRAVLVIDGSPRTLAVGDSAQGVKLVSLSAGTAVVEYGGRRTSLQLSNGPVNVAGSDDGGAQRDGGGRISIPVSTGGHFITQGRINGKPVSFMVDTGATSVSLGQDVADAIGLKYREGRRGLAQTANGTVTMYIVKLHSVRIGDVQVYDVEAAVVPQPMGHVLLGNSFLSRFQMKRDSDILVLERRY
jgi:aspartyl protease family protein